jgi:O-antigen ligase
VNVAAGTYTAPGRAMNVSAPRLQQVAPSATPILSLSPNAIISIVFVACVGVGSLMAINPKAAVAALVALCYLPLVLINLPLGIALWIPTTFLTGLSGFDSASHAAGLVIAFAWFGTLRNKAREQQVAIPTKLLTVVMLLVIWLALSMIWAEKPASSFTALQPWAACALMFVVLMTLDLTRAQIRMLILAFIIGVTVSVLIGLVGGVKVPTDTSALVDDGRLRGGLDDPNYLAAGIVPSLALAAGLFSGIRSALGRFALAAACIALVIGLGATESRGGLIAAFVAILTGVIIAKRGRVFVVAFLVIIIGVGCVWFASDPAAYKRVTHTADKGNGRSSLWIVGGRIWKDHPIIGVGLDNYRAYAPRYVGSAGLLTFVDFIAERPHVVHNVYLQTMVEVGLVGLALFLTILITSLAQAMRAARRFERRGDHEASALSRSVFVALLSALIASFFLSNGSGFQIWTLLSFGPILWRYAERTKEADPVPAAAPAPLPFSRPEPALQA